MHIYINITIFRFVFKAIWLKERKMDNCGFKILEPFQQITSTTWGNLFVNGYYIYFLDINLLLLDGVVAYRRILGGNVNIVPLLANVLPSMLPSPLVNFP